MSEDDRELNLGTGCKCPCCKEILSNSFLSAIFSGAKSECSFCGETVPVELVSKFFGKIGGIKSRRSISEKEQRVLNGKRSNMLRCSRCYKADKNKAFMSIRSKTWYHVGIIRRTGKGAVVRCGICSHQYRTSAKIGLSKARKYRRVMKKRSR